MKDEAVTILLTILDAAGMPIAEPGTQQLQLPAIAGHVPAIGDQVILSGTHLPTYRVLQRAYQYSEEILQIQLVLQAIR